MKRVVTADEMREIEKRATTQGVSQEELMERAAVKLKEYIVNFVQKKGLDKDVLILAGKGNNGGDAYACARNLLDEGFKVTLFQVLASDVGSLSYQKNSNMSQKAAG